MRLCHSNISSSNSKHFGDCESNNPFLCFIASKRAISAVGSCFPLTPVHVWCLVNMHERVPASDGEAAAARYREVWGWGEESRPLCFLSLLSLVCGRARLLSEETHISPSQLMLPSAVVGGFSGFKKTTSQLFPRGRTAVLELVAAC